MPRLDMRVDNDLRVPRVVSCYKRNLVGTGPDGTRDNALSLACLSGADIETREKLAEEEGFEPSIRFHVYTLSRRAP